MKNRVCATFRLFNSGKPISHNTMEVEPSFKKNRNGNAAGQIHSKRNKNQ